MEYPIWTEFEKNMTVGGKLCHVKVAVRFDPEQAATVLVPLAVHAPFKLSEECDGIVTLQIREIHEIVDDAA